MLSMLTVQNVTVIAFKTQEPENRRMMIKLMIDNFGGRQTFFGYEQIKFHCIVSRTVCGPKHFNLLREFTAKLGAFLRIKLDHFHGV